MTANSNYALASKIFIGQLNQTDLSILSERRLTDLAERSIDAAHIFDIVIEACNPPAHE